MWWRKQTCIHAFVGLVLHIPQGGVILGTLRCVCCHHSFITRRRWVYCRYDRYDTGSVSDIVTRGGATQWLCVMALLEEYY